jgi:hypothetical protein
VFTRDRTVEPKDRLDAGMNQPVGVLAVDR